jgi:hypothetical protein
LREQVLRQARADFNEPLQVGFDLFGGNAGVERERDDFVFDLDAQVAVGEQAFHHLRVADVVGEFFVRRAHQKRFGKFGGLELDVLVAERLGDFREKIFRAG